VADALAQRGLRVVLTGTDAEAPISSAVAAAMRAEPLDLTGRTSLGGLGALVRDAAVTVTNDTGTSHLAAAVGGPSVVVYSTSDRDRWAPIDESLHRRVGTGAPESADVPVADVVAAVDALLARA
jgi:ADP-heptose:LPS heptosyltransferase